MGKFKIGDKVKIRQWDDMEKEFGLDTFGSINVRFHFPEGMRKYCGKVMTITDIWGDNYTLEGARSWSFSEDMFEPTTSTIVIYKKDNKVIAFDKRTGKTGEAICNSEDTFDFYTGADLAYERLRGRKPAPKAREEAPKYFTGEMVCVSAANSWYTKGKIYKVKNGVWVDDDGDPHETTYKNVEEINLCCSSQFIKVIK